MKGLWLALAAGVVACGDAVGPDPDPDPVTTIVATEVASGLSNPLLLTAPPGDGRLFVVEQPGRIRVIRDGTLLAQPFLDLTGQIAAGGERGLLGLAFAPNYAATGHLWVNYTDPSGHTRVVRYRVSAQDQDRADPQSALLVLRVEQPAANHNGGHIAFGPDGMLYIALGDGGGAGDPWNNGQNRNTLLGALLRIDARGAEPYAVPPDNPFRNTADARPEIWAYGLRNPWRFSFDRATGMLYVADVGQSQWEEINAVPGTAAGVNYGWRIMEGAHCYNASTCNRQGLTEPVHEYANGSEHCSVTGGYVYRGTRLAGLQGHYFYSDYCGGWLRSLRVVNGQATDHRTWSLNTALGRVLSFGEDSAGELYVLSANGRVYRLDPG